MRSTLVINFALIAQMLNGIHLKLSYASQLVHKTMELV